MQYRDLRDFVARLEAIGELRRVRVEVDPRLEMTEVCDRVLRAGGPALLFERPKGHTMPVLANLFGTPRRVALGMGRDSVEELREVGRLLAAFRPDILRVNLSEARALLGLAGREKGVDSAGDADRQTRASVAAELAAAYDCAVLLSGEEDIVADGRRAAAIH